MSQAEELRPDWRDLWASGDLGRFCFISLGIVLHASNETMIATIMPSMISDISGVELVGWSLSIYEIGSITAGAAAGRLVSYMALRRGRYRLHRGVQRRPCWCAAPCSSPAVRRRRLR